jgi:hypothetical protein
MLIGTGRAHGERHLVLQKYYLGEPLAKRLVLSGLGGVADPVGESLMLHFVFWQRQIGNCRRASSGLCFRIGRHVSDAGRVLAAT